MNPYLKNLDAFADLLAACNVIDEAAVHDAVDYDGEVTLGNIAIAHRRLMAEETADSICESLKRERDEARGQRDRLAEVIKVASVLIAAKGRHNTMLAYNGLRDALQSLTPNAKP